MATDANKPEGSNDEAVVFDDKQQARVNEIVKDRLARQAKQHDEALNTLKSDFQKQLDELKAAQDANKDDGNRDDGKGKKPPTDDIKAAIEAQFKQLLDAEKAKATAAQAQAEKMKTEREAALKEAYAVRKETAMRKAAGEAANFFNVDDVLALTDKTVEFDSDANDWVVKENGVVKQNSELKPMTLKEYYEQWAQARPHFVNGDVKSGAGSSENKGGAGKGGTVTKRSDLKGASAIADYIGKFGLDAYEKLPA